MTSISDIIFPNQEFLIEENHSQAIIDLRIQKRNNRQSLTLIEGLDGFMLSNLELTRMLKSMKKTFSTNGALLKSPNKETIVQLQGDQRDKVRDFLIGESVCQSSQIKIHGY